jgi:hypothetical protein
MTAPFATKTDLKAAIQELKIWTGSIAAASVTILVAALHFWPAK